MTRRRRFLAALAAGVGLTLAVAGCGVSAPKVTPEAKPAQPPAVLEQSQVSAILSAVKTELTASNKAKSTAALLTRFANPALSLRQTEYSMATAGADNTVIDDLGTGFTGTIVSATTSWPRSFIVGVNSVKSNETGYLYLVTQQTPRSRYAVTMWASVLPNIHMPATKDIDKGGNPVVSANDTSGTRLASPSQALAWYSDLIVKGQTSAHASMFPVTPDVSLSQWNAIVKAYADAFIQIHGSAGQTATPVKDSEFAVATADGGTLVMGEITIDLTLSMPAGATQSINLTRKFSTFTGGNISVTQTAQLTYSEMVALWIPSKKTAGGKITVLAASQVPSGAVIK